MFAFGTSMLIQAVTVGFVAKLGGGAAAWRTVAIIYAIIGLIVNNRNILTVIIFNRDINQFNVIQLIYIVSGVVALTG